MVDVLRKTGAAARLATILAGIVSFGSRRARLSAARPAPSAVRRISAAPLAATELVDHLAERRVDAALAAGPLPIALQPIVDLGSGRMVGVEALARFTDGRAPEAWFIDARTTRRGLELERLAFDSAVRLLPDVSDDCYLSINATPRLLTEGELLDELAGRLLPYQRIVIEITEHARVCDYATLRASLSELRGRGVRIAVDDTGAGFASFSHVLELRPDIIKIDRSLVTTLTADPARRALITALVLLALEIGASVTAEGVESPQELETLAALGVDAAQGYLIAKPTTDNSHWFSWPERNWLYPEQSVNQGAPKATLLTLP